MSVTWRYFDPNFRYEHELTDTSQAWSGHRLFVYDLVRNIKPAVIVELGTHHGNSYFAMCEALRDEGLTTTQITAVDTWTGDKHAGFYSNDVFTRFRAILKKYYESLDARYIQSTFDEAVSQVPAASINLLHIDGLHTYEAVKHDVTQWFSRVADGGIIILHDIHEFRDDFGVHILWDELRSQFPTISFFHSHGLGVLVKGANPFISLFKNHESIWQRYYQITYDYQKMQHALLREQLEREKITADYYTYQNQSQEELRENRDATEKLTRALDQLEQQHEIDIAWIQRKLLHVERERDEAVDESARRTQELLRYSEELSRRTQELLIQKEKNSLLHEEVGMSYRKQLELQQENTELTLVGIKHKQELDRIKTTINHLAEAKQQLDQRIWAQDAEILKLQEQVHQNNQLLSLIGQSKFWKLREVYMRTKWGLTHPIQACKKYILRGVPIRQQLRHLFSVIRNGATKMVITFMRRPVLTVGESTTRSPGLFYTGHIIPGSVAVVLHLYHEDMWVEIVRYLSNIKHPFFLYVSLTQGNHSDDIAKKITQWKPDARVTVFENKGLDIIPFVKLLQDIPREVKYILKIHTKKSPYNPSMGRRWFEDLMDHVLRSPEYVNGVLHNLEYTDAGMIGGSTTPPLGAMFHSSEVREPAIDLIYKALGDTETEFYWISGSMFWVRRDILNPLFDKKFVRLLDKYQPSGYHENGTIAHSVERYFGKLVYDAGRVIYLEPQTRYGSGVIRSQLPVVAGTLPVSSHQNYYAFFHICCINNYREVVRELMAQLLDSGLYDRITTIYYVLLGVPTPAFIDEMRSYSKAQCVYMSTDITDVEYPIITYMYQFAQNNDGYFLYFHTKGVSAPQDPVRRTWRNRLTKKTITEYRTCVEYLHNGCDVAGCGWKEHPHQSSINPPYTIYKHSHFSGNFFWATSTYIKTLPDPQSIESAHRSVKYVKDIRFEEYRVMCEVWIGINNPRVGINGDVNVDYMHE